MTSASHTPERVLFQELTKALVQALGRKKGERLLSCLVDGLSVRADYAEAIPIRTTADYPASREATRQAVEVLRADLPSLIAALNR